MTGNSPVESIIAAKRMLEELPPAPLFVSSTILPDEKALNFTFEKRDYVGAHPDFWARLPVGCLDLPSPIFGLLGGIRIVDIDADAAARNEFWHALREVMTAAREAAARPTGRAQPNRSEAEGLGEDAAPDGAAKD